MKIEIKGMAELQAAFKKMPSNAESAVKKELKIITLDLQGKAQKLAPVDTGDLKGSAFAEIDGLNGTVGFTEPYALRQHEEVGYRHPKGGEAKYLETPYKENAGKYADAIIAEVKKVVDKHV